MKNSLTAILIIVLLTGTTACDKKKDQPEAVTRGQWRGFVHIYNAILVNRTDGTSRLYLRVPFGDTAAAEGKYEGIYTYNGNIFSAQYFTGSDSVYLASIHTSPGVITGTMTLQEAPGFSYYFELRQ